MFGLHPSCRLERRAYQSKGQLSRVLAGALPDDFDRVTRDLRVHADEREVFDEGLRYEQAVEGISMVVREVRYTNRVAKVDGQYLHGINRELPGEVGADVFGRTQLAQLRFDSDLPSAHDAEEQLVACIRKGIARPPREPPVISYPPEKGVRVQQDPQRSKYFWISSGNGSSKSSETQSVSFALPGVRRAGCSVTATSRATGFPALAMTTSSPWLTFSRRRDRCVLASWMFTVVLMTLY